MKRTIKKVINICRTGIAIFVFAGLLNLCNVSAQPAGDTGEAAEVQANTSQKVEKKQLEDIGEKIKANIDDDDVKPDVQAQLFGKKCAGCHTIGRGNLVGPDLDDATQWPIPELKKNVTRMQSFVGVMSDEEIKALVTFLKDPEVKQRIKSDEERVLRAQVSEQPASAEAGKRLFEGKEGFANGGIACIACHTINGKGGTLGTDLTTVHEKLGEAALLSACENPSYPIMKAIYSSKPVTKQEALHLTKYFSAVTKDPDAKGDPPVVAYGLVGSGLFLGWMVVYYRKRNTGVHKRLKRK